MTLPIGSGFYTGDIPGQYSRKTVITDKAKALSEDSAAQKASSDYIKSSPQGVALAEQFNASQSAATRQTIYDQPTNPKISKAISTYTEFANLERRAEVQALIGVDTYA